MTPADADRGPRATGSELPSSMRAVVLTGYGGLERLVLRDDVAVPVPQPDEVLVEVGACGLNNTDINLRAGWYGSTVDMGLTEDLGLEGAAGGSSWDRSHVAFPRIQGAAVAGVVRAVGSRIENTRVGERVLVDPSVRDAALPARAQLVEYLGSERDGGFAEYVVVPSVNACAINSEFTDVELATFPCSYDTAEEMLERARLGHGETVLVTGAAGGVGTAAIQLALVRGAHVVAVAGRSKEHRLRALGAHDFVARETSDLRAAIERVSGPRGVHVVMDVVGGSMFDAMMKVLARGGRYATAGAIGGPTTQIDLRDLIYKDLEFYGITNPTFGTFGRLVGLIESGQLHPLLEQSFPLEALKDAQALMLKREHVGKFVVAPQDHSQGATAERPQRK